MNYETVARVADEMRKSDPAGRNPSVRKVFARAGGDYNQVAEHMRTWRAQQPLGPAAAPPELTTNLLKALRDEIAHHRGAAASEQARELEECREELEDLRREYALSLAGKRELEQQVALAAAERERLAADGINLSMAVEKLQEQLATERAVAEGARIDLAQTRLKASGDAELVTTLRSELDVRRSEIEAERGGRVDAERQLAGATAALEAQAANIADLLGRLQAVESARSAAQASLDAERSLRFGAERERDVALERVAAAVARAEDLMSRESVLRNSAAAHR
jgi:chromosome segregation ATPase